MARMEGIYSRNGENVLFVVMYRSVDLTLVSQEMKDCLESESYLAFPHDEAENPSFGDYLYKVCKDKGIIR